MTKEQVIAEIAQKTGQERCEVSNTLEAYFKVVKNHLANGETICIRGFATMGVKFQKARVARNISRNTTVNVAEKAVPYVKFAAFVKWKVGDSKEALAAVKKKKERK